jgi:hypothetical protein
MKRLAILILAVALCGAPILRAKTAEHTSPQAAYIEKTTGIVFPAAIGALAFEGTEDFGDERYGVGIKYSGEGIAGTIYIYNDGLASIPSGVDSPIHKAAVDTAVNGIKEVAGQGQYQDLAFGREEIAGLSGRPGSHRARHAALAYTFDGTRWYSHIFVLGYKNQIVKLRFSYVQESKAAGEEQLKILTKWLDEAMK